jgi:hypothetical protein
MRQLVACAAACVAFAVTFLLRQRTFYKDDGDVYLMSILEGKLEHPHHMLYKPLIAGLHQLLSRCGASLYDAAVLASALGTALGVGCACAASRMLGLSRGAALATAALMLSVPAVLFFATVVELHGVFLGFAGPCFVVFAALARTPTVVRGVWWGLALAFAYIGHASAGLLPALLLPLALFYPRYAPTPARVRQLALPALAAGLVFATALLLLPSLGRITGLGVDTGSAAAYVARDAAAFAADVKRWATTLLYEWVLPYAPLNVLALLACFVGAARAQARWLWLAVLPYYLVCVLLLPSAEFGAYFTPFAWPLALLALRVAPPAWLVACGALGYAFGVWWIGAHDRPELAQRFAAGVQAATGGHAPSLLLGDHDDVKATLIALPAAANLLVLHAGAVPESFFPDVMQRLDAYLQAQWQQGRVVLLTAGAARVLEQVVPSGARVLPALQARYRVTRVDYADATAAFAGYRVEPR